MKLVEARIGFNVPTQCPHGEGGCSRSAGCGRPADARKGQQGPLLQRRDIAGRKAPAGFGVRVTAGGTKSFVLFHRVDGRKFLETLGRWDENEQGGTLTVRDAIVRADKLAKDIKNGRREDPRPDRTRRLEDGDSPEGLKVGGAFDPDADEADREQKYPGLLDMFVDRYCRKEAQLKSADQYASTFRRLVAPDVGTCQYSGKGGCAVPRRRHARRDRG